jgi:hypothetical protein
MTVFDIVYFWLNILGHVSTDYESVFKWNLWFRAGQTFRKNGNVGEESGEKNQKSSGGRKATLHGKFLEVMFSFSLPFVYIIIYVKCQSFIHLNLNALQCSPAVICNK